MKAGPLCYTTPDMLQHLAQVLIDFIVAHGAFGVFTASFVEEVIVPIPSTIVQTGAGFLLLQHATMSFATVFKLVVVVAIPAAIGATLGSLLLYGIVYWGGMAAVRRFGKYFLITPEKVEHAKKVIMERPSILIGFTILRFIPLIPNSLITAAAGFVRLPIVPFLVTTSIGIFIRALYLGIAGWLTARAYGSITGAHSAIASLGVVVASAGAVSIITMGVVMLVNHRKARKKRHAQKAN